MYYKIRKKDRELSGELLECNVIIWYCIILFFYFFCLSIARSGNLHILIFDTKLKIEIEDENIHSN